MNLGLPWLQNKIDARKRFIAARKRNFAFYSFFLKFAQCISSESNAIHVIKPAWTFDFA